MHKYFLIITVFLLLSHCSLDTKTGLWTQSKIVESEKEVLEEIFKSDVVLEKEFNSNLKIKIKSPFIKNSFVNNLTNNHGYLNFESNFKEISNFKFKKIKNFDYITPDELIGYDIKIGLVLFVGCIGALKVQIQVETETKTETWTAFRECIMRF